MTESLELAIAFHDLKFTITDLPLIQISPLNPKQDENLLINFIVDV